MTVTYLTSEDVARITGLSAYTVRAAIREGDLPGSKRRGRYLIHPDDLACWIDEGRVRPGGDVKGVRPVTSTTPTRPSTPTPPGGVLAMLDEMKRAAA